MNEIIAEPKSNSFTSWVAQHRGGDFSHDIWQQIKAAVAATSETQKPSVIVITLKVSALPGGAYLMDDDTTTKLPKFKSPPAIYYGDADNNLVRENPAQLSMDLKAVPALPVLPTETVVNN